MSHADQPLSVPRLTTFVSLEIPMATFLLPLVLYIPAFYAGELGLGLVVVGTVFGLTKIGDVVTDPIIGALTDRYGPPGWRRRFWLLVSMPIMLLGIYRIFLPPPDMDWIYFAFWMMFLYIGWTLLQITHISWGIELSSERNERARIAAYRQAAALLGSVLVVFIPVIADQVPGLEEGARIRWIGLFTLVMLPLLLCAVFLSTGEQRRPRDESGSHRWRDVFSIFGGNRSLRALVYGNMGMLLGIASVTGVLLFYVEQVLRLGNWATLALFPFLFSGLLFLPGWRYLARRFGNKRTFRFALLIQIPLLPIFVFIPAENLLASVVCFIILGSNHGVAAFLPQAMMAELKDMTIRGRITNRTGTHIAILQSTSKVCGALGVALMYAVLHLAGFDPDPAVVNDEASLDNLRLAVAGVPALCYFMGWLGMRRYALS